MWHWFAMAAFPRRSLAWSRAEGEPLTLMMNDCGYRRWAFRQPIVKNICVSMTPSNLYRQITGWTFRVASKISQTWFHLLSWSCNNPSMFCYVIAITTGKLFSIVFKRKKKFFFPNGLTRKREETIIFDSFRSLAKSLSHVWSCGQHLWVYSRLSWS